MYSLEGQLLPGGGPFRFSDFFKTTDSVFDPKALYDKAQGRFVLLATSEHESPDSSTFMLAVSHTSNPTQGWCIYELDAMTAAGTATAAGADFPGLGMDGD